MSYKSGVLMSTTLDLNIERWSAWAPGLETEDDWRAWARGEKVLTDDFAYPKLTVLPSLMRRRLSSLGKIALKVAYDCRTEGESLRTIFSSRHGEANQTVGLLGDITGGEPVSPTKFSLSVHNTGSGLFTITSQNTAPSTAVAARLDSFEMGCVEAHGALATGREERVMMVFADTPLEPPFDILVDYEPPFAAGFLLSSKPGSHSLRLTMAVREEGEELSQTPHGLSFMRFLLQPDSPDLRLVTDRLAWTWSRERSRP